MRRAPRPGAAAGFTLVELLVGLALLGVLLVAVNGILIGTVRGTGQLNTQGALQQETLNGQALIAARLKEAWYVYPAGSTLAFASTPLIRNPVSGTSTFTVGSQPALALVLPPRTRGAPCVPNTAANAGCYRFFAYYGMQRAAWQAAASGFKDPGGAAAPDSWVLAEYRADYAGVPAVSATPPPIPAGAADSSGINLLAEHLAPAVGGAAPQYQLFTLDTRNVRTAAQPATWPVPHVQAVRLQLRVTQLQGGQARSLPSATGTYALTIYPENIGLGGL